MYDKHGVVLRIETTTNDVSFFKHHRRVTATRELAPVKKLQGILLGCNRRYIAYPSRWTTSPAGIRALAQLTKPREVDGKTPTYLQ
jgi:hypothetical protein